MNVEDTQRLLVLLSRIAVSLESLTERPLTGSSEKFPTVNLQIPPSGANMREFRESLDGVLWHSQLDGSGFKTVINPPPK